VAGALDDLEARRARLGDPPPEGAAAGLVAGLDVLASLMIDHTGDNAFAGGRLDDALARLGARNLLVAGVPTDGLVHATQRAAGDRGYECLAVADASAGTTPERHAAQLRITTFGNGLFGAVADTAAVLAALEARP
jgi:nicotinamidase-related amidase